MQLVQPLLLLQAVTVCCACVVQLLAGWHAEADHCRGARTRVGASYNQLVRPCNCRCLNGVALVGDGPLM
jgi:hypothetical protein